MVGEAQMVSEQAQRVCPHCGQWMLREDDAYCGYCDAPQSFVTLSQDRIRLVAGVDGSASIRIGNSAAVPVALSILPTDIEGADLISLTPEGDVEIPPAGERELRLTLRQDRLPEDFGRRTVPYLLTMVGKSQERLPLEVEILAGPRLVVSPAKLRFDDDPKAGRTEQPLHLANKGQWPLTVTDVHLEGGGGLSLLLPEAVPFRIDPGEVLTVPVAYSGGAAAREAATPASIRVVTRELSQEPVTVAVHVRCARLVSVPEHVAIDPCLSLHRQTSRIVLKNAGTEDIEIREIACDAPWVELQLAKRQIVLGAATDDAAGSPGAPSQIGFEVLVHPENLPQGWSETWLTVHAGENMQVTIPLRVRVVTPRKEPYPEYIGIDFGTTASVISINDPAEGDIRSIDQKNADGTISPLIPSVLVMTRVAQGEPDPRKDDYIIGREAVNIAGARPNEAVRSIKRIMGFNNARVMLGKTFTPQDIAACIIRRLMDIAERALYDMQTEYLGQPQEQYASITRAMVTVPANFFDRQILSILNACRKSGLDIGDAHSGDGSSANTGIVIDEPSAAALFYMRQLRSQGRLESLITEGKANFLIYDHGGGTLDVSVVGITLTDNDRGGKDINVKVLANKGDNGLGGDSFDLAVMREMLGRCARQRPDFDVQLIEANYKVIEQRAAAETWKAETMANVLRARSVWKDAGEQVKIALSTEEATSVVIDALSIGRIAGNAYHGGDEPFECRIDTQELQELLGGLLLQSQDLVKGALDLGALASDQIDYVIHTGRTSLMPLVQRAVAALFPHLPRECFVLEEETLKVCVAKGAVLYGLMRMEQEDTGIKLEETGYRLPHAYGVGKLNMLGKGRTFEQIVPIGVKCPHTAERTYDFTGTVRQFRFYQNAGHNTGIEGNPEVTYLGQYMANNTSRCCIQFVVSASRLLEIYVNRDRVQLDPQPMKEDERWVG